MPLSGRAVSPPWGKPWLQFPELHISTLEGDTKAHRHACTHSRRELGAWHLFIKTAVVGCRYPVPRGQRSKHRQLFSHLLPGCPLIIFFNSCSRLVFPQLTTRGSLSPSPPPPQLSSLGKHSPLFLPNPVALSGLSASVYHEPRSST